MKKFISSMLALFCAIAISFGQVPQGINYQTVVRNNNGAIIANQTGNFAAKVCADYSVTDNGVTYGDWYLPSKYELDLLYQQRNAVGGFTNQFYWTSTEFGVNHAWGHAFSNGVQAYNNKDYPNYVRTIRAF